jgi:hypothetical protein
MNTNWMIHVVTKEGYLESSDQINGGRNVDYILVFKTACERFAGN